MEQAEFVCLHELANCGVPTSPAVVLWLLPRLCMPVFHITAGSNPVALAHLLIMAVFGARWLDWLGHGGAGRIGDR